VIVVATDARTDPRPDKDIVARLGSRPIVNGPVALAGKKLGTIGTGTFGDEGVRHLSSLECEFLSALASHAAAVIDRVTAAQARNQAELALRASEERLRTVTDTAQVGLVIVDQQHRYRYANPSYARILHLPTHEIVGQHVADVLPEVYPEQIRPRLDQAFAGERVSYELSITSPVTGESGRYYVVTYEPKKDHPDPVVVVVIVDITERKHAEDLLRASEGRYRALFDCAPDGIVVADPQGTYLDANTSVLRMLGYAHEEFIGLDASHIVVPAEVPHIEPALSKINSGTDYHREWQFRRKDGSTFAAEVIASLMPDGNVLAMFRDITERKQAEDELRRTNALLHAVADGTADAVFVKDLEGRYLLFNEAASRFAGRLPAEVLGKDDTALFDAEGAKQVMAHDRAVRESGQSQTNEECLTAAAVTRTYLATKSPYRDAQGNIIGTIGISHDITQRKRTEEALRNSEIRFHTVWEMANDALRLVDENGVIVAVNEAFCRLVGISRQELEGRPFTETYLGDRNPLELQQRFQERFRERRIPAHEERRMTFRAGNTVELEITSTFVELPGHPALLFGLFRDVTERKRAEQDLRESRRLLEKAQEVGHVGSWISDAGLTRKLTWSAETCRIFGLAPEKFGGNVEAFLSLVHPEDRKAIEEASLAALAGERLYNLEHRIVRPDGSLRWVHEQADVERNSAGQPVRMVGVVQDITERRELEEQFRQSQKMDAIGQLAGGVAHDFNNILAAMMMQTELLVLTEDLPLEVQNGLQDIQASAERAANLTRQLLLFSRKQVMHTRELDLNEAVTSLFKMLQRIIGEHLDLQFNLCPRSLNIHADPGMLDQVLMNLVVNARDAMPEGGRITIVTSEKNLTKEEAAALPETSAGRYACMQVIDTGCGIPRENLTRIFEPFFTTKDPGKGTGLGLATVFGIVKQHGGTVIVESEVGRGTSFQILLPVAKPLEKAAEKTTVKAKPRGGTETILLVEDDTSVRVLTRIVLERAGYRVVEASNGVEALELWSEHQDSVRLLLTDIVMPEGVSGRELAARLQTQNPKLRVVFTSGYSADIAGRELALAEGQNFIQKPAPPHKLLETVRHSLDDAR
ncbi:MAG: multi-sensor hybrid histidine kinase, partial [Verrucomicrobia bacterium]|nr:multi-sensor hybrid histidine kinase [Verrucomicrobiota bacterium]